MTEDLVRRRADEALRFALAHDYPNHVVGPLLAATHGEAAHIQHIQQICPIHGEPQTAELLVIEDRDTAHEWNRPDDGYLGRILDRMRFEAHLDDYYRRGCA